MRSGARQHGPPLNSLWQIKQRQMMEDPAVMSVTDKQTGFLREMTRVFTDFILATSSFFRHEVHPFLTLLLQTR